MQSLQHDTVRGYLKGFIDLVFAHEGKWHILDWKSNHLGNTPSHYNADAIYASMSDHHYILQYHIYMVAAVQPCRMPPHESHPADTTTVGRGVGH